MTDIIHALGRLKALRSQLDDHTFQWNPETMESWRNDVQEALNECGILEKCRPYFDAIPPGKTQFFAVASMVDSTFHKTKYTESNVQDFLHHGIEPAKHLLDAIVSAIESGLKTLEKKYREVVVKQIEDIIEMGPNRG